MKRLLLLMCILIMFIMTGIVAEGSSSVTIDFTITEEINMTAYEGSTDLQVEPLVISNNSQSYGINVNNIYIETAGQWELVKSDTDFKNIEKNSKKVSFKTDTGYDMYLGPYSLGLINCGEEKEVRFDGNMSKLDSTILKEHVANIVVEINPVLDCSTVLYEDGTFIVNELTTDRNKNSNTHGTVIQEFEPLGVVNSYEFATAEDVLWKDSLNDIKKVEIGSYIKPKSMAYWFHKTYYLTYADVTNIDTSMCTSTYMMFLGSGSRTNSSYVIEGLDNWDVSKVKTFAGMFNQCGYKCTSWDIGDLSKWTLDSAENIANMFYLAGYGITNWYVGDLNNWNVSKVTNFNNTFRQTGEASEFWSVGDLSGWDTSSATNMSYMFYNAGYTAKEWNIGDLSNWDVSNVENFDYMFYSAAHDADNVDLGDLNWDMKSATSAKYMFASFAYLAENAKLGHITIWNNCDITYFMRNVRNCQAIISFETVCDKADYCLSRAATRANGNIQLIAKGENVLAWLETLVSLYGANGTTSIGNIWI